MGAFECNVDMDKAPTKKSFHKKWEKVMYSPGDGSWWGMNGYNLMGI